MRMRCAVAMVAVLAISGCTTTEEANVALQSAWIGRDSDDFFSRFGAPYRSFERNDGGTIYSWRGGQTSRMLPAQYETVEEGGERRTTTVVTDEDGGERRETRVTSEAPRRVMTEPARRQSLYCEADITTDRDGIIRAVGVTSDTDGEGLSFSRCGELFPPAA